MATYEKGDAYDDVARIQEALGIAADGKFGAATVKAVKAWQRDNGAEADGMVGPDMLKALGLDDLILLEDGDLGDLVRRTQEALGIKADGECGKQTIAAVKAFQKQNGLKANGIADAATLQALGVWEDEAAPEAAPPPPAPTRPTVAPVQQPAAPRAPAAPATISS